MGRGSAGVGARPGRGEGGQGAPAPGAAGAPRIRWPAAGRGGEGLRRGGARPGRRRAGAGFAGWVGDGAARGGRGRGGAGQAGRARGCACVSVLCGVSECVGRPTHLVRVSPFAECWAEPALSKGFCFFKKNSLPSATSWHSAKALFVEC